MNSWKEGRGSIELLLHRKKLADIREIEVEPGLTIRFGEPTSKRGRGQFKLISISFNKQHWDLAGAREWWGKFTVRIVPSKRLGKKLPEVVSWKREGDIFVFICRRQTRKCFSASHYIGESKQEVEEGKKGRIGERWEELKRLARIAQPTQEQVNPLVKVAAWLMDQGQGGKLLDLLAETKDEDAWNNLSFALEEAGYRLEVGYRGKLETLIPFAWPIAFCIPPEGREELAKRIQFPEETLLEIAKFIRKGFHLSEEASIVIFAKLYRFDRTEWQNPVCARQFLKNFTLYTQGLCSALSPFFEEKEKVEAPSGYLLIRRILMGIISTEDAEEVEKRIFLDEWEDEPRPELSEEDIRKGTEIVTQGLAHIGLRGWKVFPNPMLHEFYEIPGACLALHRVEEITLSVELLKADKVEMHNPVAYMSMHGEDPELPELVEEIRIAVYPDPSSRSPMFTYVWEIIPDLEDPDWVTDAMIEEIVKPLGASLVILSGLLPDERCPKCGEKTFRGPPETAD